MSIGQPCSLDKGKPPEKAGRKATDPWVSDRDNRKRSLRIAELPWETIHEGDKPTRITKACQTKVGDEAAPPCTDSSQCFDSVQSRRRMPLGMRLTREERDMKNFADSIVNFLKEEDGPTAVEYAVMLALIVVVCLAAVGTIGTNANAKFEEVGAAIAGN